ncbi:putative RNA-dependent RNA polymerase SHL2 [Podospora fimiseda]|uniref:RNA-dependent RNA polymerase n=1 Tax=Podospora fimiseda TaxID=252190 RepID=A0AAN7BYA9_9PEZI|nr:putative RNA-dependent RNA polymerase SHL2 [Podospora fimiseda]
MAPFISGGMPPSFPFTPSRKDSEYELKKLVDDLNVNYGLAVQFPDRTLSPAKRQQLKATDDAFARWDTITQSIRFLHFKGLLETCLGDFYCNARLASQNWVPKQRADPSTLPEQTSYPKATTPHHRVELERLLSKVLEDWKEQALQKQVKTPSRRNPPEQQYITPSSRMSAIAESPLSHKRSSGDSDSDQSAKRRRAQPPRFELNQPPMLTRTTSTPTPKAAGLPISSILDTVPTRQRPGLDRFKKDPWSEQRNSFPGVNGFNSTPNVPQFSNNDSTLSTHKSPTWTQPLFTDSTYTRRTTHMDVSDDDKSPTTYVVQQTSRMSLSNPDSPTHPFKPSQFTPRPQLPSFESETQIRAPQSAQKNVSRILFPPGNFNGVTNKPRQLSDPSSAVSSESEIEDPDFIVLGEAPVAPKRSPAAPAPTSIEPRLENIWPNFPPWLHKAPLAVAWEITRICLHCKVDLDDSATHGIQYNPAWATATYTDLWKSLAKLPVFQGKDFPERPSQEAFAAAMTSKFEARGSVVLMSANLEFNPDKTGPLFLIDMKPLRLDQGCRLTRKFGPDRFLEVLFPSPTGMSVPDIVKKDGGAEKIIKWVTSAPHQLVGRQWRAFYAKDAGYRKPAKDFRLGPEIKPSFKERVHFFAEAGQGFGRATGKRSGRDGQFSSSASATPSQIIHTELKVSQMLDWLLELHRPKNQQQPVLKLFSRLQLGLSKTTPTVVFEPHQIRQHQQDLLSPTGNVMNDGIGLMSRSVARKIRDILGLTDIPSAVQARIGPAKGMWLMDVKDMGEEDWIETYPSQRKWDWDVNVADQYQRTLEVRSTAVELKSAGLNLQFLPVLEDRARDKVLMRQAIGERLKNDLKKEFETQKTAIKSPLLLRQWVNEHWSGRADRLRVGAVPFLGGLPEKKEEILNLLLASGFDPMKQRYLQDMAFELQKQKCDLLKTKMNIRVGRSAYIYMVVDFWGVLEENEVHVGFSSKFRDEGDDTSYTLLADCDVLVARSPAHFVSDVQKVRAVFKSELHALKDVIVFPRKGNVALADKLSGGDYDGDMAWVCWDPDIVNSFVNAEVPKDPGLSKYLGKDKVTFKQLVSSARQQDHATYDMISKSFQFAMQPNFLGICTNFKERMCYHRNSVGDKKAVLLSTLVAKLVDQSKQGIIFNKESWDRLRKDHFGIMHPDDPAYQGDVWTSKEEPQHIIDYLKFWVANPAINRELQAFDAMLKGNNNKSNDESDRAWHYDPDLVSIYKAFKERAAGSRTYEGILAALSNSIQALGNEWKRLMSNKSSELTYQEKVRVIYQKWCQIPIRSTPGTSEPSSQKLDSKIAFLLEMPRIGMGSDSQSAGHYSFWELLKASTAFWICYDKAVSFVWQMAGVQLAYIKAASAGPGQIPIAVTPLMYAGLLADGKFTKQYMARTAMDNGSEYFGDEGEIKSDDE